MKKIYHLLISSILAFGLAACGGQNAQTPQDKSTEKATQELSMPGKGVQVQALQSPLPEETFQTMLINEALSRLGYEILPIKEVSYTTTYTAVANGDATYMAVNWDPQRKELYENSGGDKVFFRKGHYIKGAAEGYLIDKKTADKYNIKTLDQLKDPEIAKAFDNDGDGKADLMGCEAGWASETVIEHHIDTFGLRDTVKQHQGQYSAMIADVVARYEAGQPVFYYTWVPYWLSAKLVPGKDVVWLQVPYSAHPDGLDTEQPNGANYGFISNNERIIANRVFAEQNPAAATIFALAELPIADVSAENLLIAQGEDTDEHIRQHTLNWIKANQEKFDGWLAQARKAAQ